MSRTKQQQREYYLKNKERILSKNKEYRLKDKEKWLKYRREYQKLNKERLNDISRLYTMEHPEKTKVYEKRRRTKDRDKLTSKQNKRRNNNPLKFNAEQQAKRNVPLKISCEICGSTNILQRHHWDYNQPLLVNTLCKQCHAIQHIKNFARWHQARLMADSRLEVTHQN
jgi:hypothetical protein